MYIWTAYQQASENGVGNISSAAHSLWDMGIEFEIDGDGVIEITGMGDDWQGNMINMVDVRTFR
jgi:hypothetical protein